MSLEVHIRKQLGHFYLNVDLDLKDGTTAILGASGCGKSLTLLSIAGVVRPDAGFIALNGRVLFDSDCHIDLPPQKRQVGCLFQHGALFPNMSVLENIACGAPRSLPRRKRLARAQDWAKDMHLEGLAKHRPSELSGGQAQRVALARVLIGKPEILLLDEPFSALDSFLREQLVTDLKSLLTSRNQEALLVTHSRDEAYELGTTLAIMENGRVLTTGAMQEVFDDPQTKTGAILTGCKNIVEARKAGLHRVRVPAWGIELESAQEVRDKTEAIGIRAHQFSPSIIENAYPIHIVEAVEEPFAWILKFRYAAQNDESPHVWWRFSKSFHQVTREVDFLGVSPRDILLLNSR